ncbi:DUF3592 domain-containing protein [Streptomyces sp. NPDC058045]|uniref:DUF3592 domain-containing protein n=1 Tax=Streptomyces sp. NPDC058045 TaxID=3346311 RepID=UPI0036DFB041
MFFVLMVASVLGFVVTLAVSVVLELLGHELPWWGPVIALGVVLATVALWGVAWNLLDAARYLDGEETVGTITEVTADDSMGPESNPAYDMLITAEVTGGGRIRRAARESPRDAPRPGQRIRFRHNTRDPDDLRDILFLKFVDGTAQRSDEEAS